MLFSCKPSTNQRKSHNLHKHIKWRYKLSLAAYQTCCGPLRCLELMLQTHSISSFRCIGHLHAPALFCITDSSAMAFPWNGPSSPAGAKVPILVNVIMFSNVYGLLTCLCLFLAWSMYGCAWNLSCFFHGSSTLDAGSSTSAKLTVGYIHIYDLFVKIIMVSQYKNTGKCFYKDWIGWPHGYILFKLLSYLYIP